MGQKTLTKTDREALQRGWRRGDSTMEIAYQLGVSMTTVYAELRRGMTDEYYPDSDRHVYDPEKGEAVYWENISKRGNRTPRENGRVVIEPRRTE